MEITPFDSVKYEIDKESGYLMVDRPQRYSSTTPTLYEFVPQTFCGERLGKHTAERIGVPELDGDSDPLDICILTERAIHHVGIIVNAIPIGGLRILDGNEADDKIIAVLRDDAAYGDWTDISQCPSSLLERIEHYFMTYKMEPGTEFTSKCEVVEAYGREEALEVIRISQQDYADRFDNLEEMLTEVLHA